MAYMMSIIYIYIYFIWAIALCILSSGIAETCTHETVNSVQFSQLAEESWEETH